MPETKTAKKPAKRNVTGFTDQEKGAMQQRVRELQTAAHRGAEPQDIEGEVLEKMAEMTPSDRAIAKRIHSIVKAASPDLSPKLWYGMPAYAKGGKLVCFFQPAKKFKTRYATLGFNDSAHLDDGEIWPVYYAVTEINPAVEAKITALVKKAVS
jgi:uncharacterized protein YdhG (YjbR/CyaY superfamily)